MSLFGRDLDEVFAYQTPKVVVLKDRYLGLLRLALVGSIFCYIFLYNILYMGLHLSVKSVEGIFRVSLRHPTMKSCSVSEVQCNTNFTAMTSLPYCKQSRVSQLTVDGHFLQKKECQMWDDIESNLFFDQGMLIPTRIRRFDQRRGCEPSASNGWSCNGKLYEDLDKNGNVQTRPGKALPVYDAFMADIGMFELIIDHGFARSGGMQRDHSMMSGYWLTKSEQSQIVCGYENLGDCPENSLKEKRDESQLELARHLSSLSSNGNTNRFLRSRDRKSRAQLLLQRDPVDDGWWAWWWLWWRRQPKPGGTAKMRPGDGVPASDEVPMVSTERGDGIRVRDILKSATSANGQIGLDLDDNVANELHKYSGETLRSAGLVVVVHIHYMNKPGRWAGLTVTPWSKIAEPYYLYTVGHRLANQVKVERTLDDPSSSTRRIRTYNGIRVVVEQSGEIAMWDNPNFLAYLGGALAMMAVATTATELILMYAMPLRKQYKERKFQQSKDFNTHDNEPGDPKPTGRIQAAMDFLDAVESQSAEDVADTMAKLQAALIERK